MLDWSPVVSLCLNQESGRQVSYRRREDNHERACEQGRCAKRVVEGAAGVARCRVNGFICRRGFGLAEVAMRFPALGKQTRVNTARCGTLRTLYQCSSSGESAQAVFRHTRALAAELARCAATSCTLPRKTAHCLRHSPEPRKKPASWPRAPDTARRSPDLHRPRRRHQTSMSARRARLAASRAESSSASLLGTPPRPQLRNRASPRCVQPAARAARGNWVPTG